MQTFTRFIQIILSKILVIKTCKIKSIEDGINLLKKHKTAYKNGFEIKQHILINSKKFVKGLKLVIKEMDYDNIRVGSDLASTPYSTVDTKWMRDDAEYEQVSENAFAHYNEERYPNDDLNHIKHFLYKINRGIIDNKKDVEKEFKKLMNKIKNQNLRLEIAKEVEYTIFGHDGESEYEEDIAERVKMRKQSKESADDEDSNVCNNKGFKMRDYYNVNGVNRQGFNEDGYNINGVNRQRFKEDSYNINGVNKKGFKEDSYNINGYNINGINKVS